jgi:hypothetical protein
LENGYSTAKMKNFYSHARPHKSHMTMGNPTPVSVKVNLHNNNNNNRNNYEVFMVIENKELSMEKSFNHFYCT